MKKELKKSINALSTKIMDNKAMLFQARANIEENRLMVLSNYAAASSGNQQLAIHNTDDIFNSRKTILDSYDCKTEEQARYVEEAKRSFRVGPAAAQRRTQQAQYVAEPENGRNQRPINRS